MTNLIRQKDLLLILRSVNVFAVGNQREDLIHRTQELQNEAGRYDMKYEFLMNDDFAKKFGDLFPYAVAGVGLADEETKKNVCDLVCEFYECMDPYALSSTMAVAKIQKNKKKKEACPFYRLYTILKIQQSAVSIG